MDPKLTLSRREVFGKKAKTLKNEGKVLANVFGKGRNSIAAYADSSEIEKVVAAAGKHHPIDLTLDDGKELQVLVNDIERDFKTQKLHHVSFMVVIKGQKVTTEVPVHLIGEAPAQRVGLIVVTMVDSLEVEALPSKLPEALEVSIDGLAEDGDSVHISDIKVPEDVVIKVEDDRLIAKVETPRAEIEEEPEDEEATDAADVPSEHGGDDGEANEADSDGGQNKESED